MQHIVSYGWSNRRLASCVNLHMTCFDKSITTPLRVPNMLLEVEEWSSDTRLECEQSSIQSVENKVFFIYIDEALTIIVH